MKANDHEKSARSTSLAIVENFTEFDWLLFRAWADGWSRGNGHCPDPTCSLDGPGILEFMKWRKSAADEPSIERSPM